MKGASAKVMSPRKHAMGSKNPKMRRTIKTNMMNKKNKIKTTKDLQSKNLQVPKP